MDVNRADIDVVKLFGKDRAQEDANLKYYFVKTAQYDEISQGSRELVLGRKGAGKSAIFEALASEKELSSEIPVKISFDGEDFIYINNKLRSHEIGELVSDEFKYSLAWKDFIITEIVFSSLSKLEKTNSMVQKMLVEKGFVKEKTWIKFANSMLKVIKGAKLQSVGGEIDFDFTPLTELLDTDRIVLRDEINEIIHNNNFFVLIDNLDEPWKNSPEMNAWLRGLVFAIRQIKREFNNLKVVAFLRTDIYDVISRGSDLFDSKSEITTIDWDDNNFYSLKLLVASRIAYYFHKSPPNNLSQIPDMWDIVFPASVNYGQQKTVVLSDYLIERTFRRPRELLQFCRQIVSESRANALPIEENAISPAEIIYSNWKVNDLAGEYSQTYKQIDTCILSFIGARKTWDWPCQSILSHISSCQPEEIIIRSNGIAVSPKECVEILYLIGFLRKVIIRGGGWRKQYKLYYQDPNINFINTVFDIHPAFRKKFVQ